jgi:hypothetical protein
MHINQKSALLKRFFHQAMLICPKTGMESPRYFSRNCKQIFDSEYTDLEKKYERRVKGGNLSCFGGTYRRTSFKNAAMPISLR